MEVVECVKKLFLSPALPGEELDIVHQEQLHRAIPPPEFVTTTLSDGGHEVIGELFRGDIQRVFTVLRRPLRDRLEEMCLTEARRAIDVKRVVVFARLF